MSGDGRDPQTLAEETLRLASVHPLAMPHRAALARWGLDEHAARVAAEQRAREAVDENEWLRAVVNGLEAKHERGSGKWWAGWHRDHCAAAQAAHDREQQRDAETERADREKARADHLAETVERVRALADYWQTVGDPACVCGHTLGEHNGLGCYARLSYSPLITCSCTLTDDRTHGLIAAENLLRALADVSTADGTDTDAPPEATTQPDESREVCRDCGAPWRPVRRGECSRCGSDAGPIKSREGGQ